MEKVRYLTEKEVSEITGRAVQTLRNDRHKSKGLPYIKIEKGAVRYNENDVYQWMESRKVIPGKRLHAVQ